MTRLQTSRWMQLRLAYHRGAIQPHRHRHLLLRPHHHQLLQHRVRRFGAVPLRSAAAVLHQRIRCAAAPADCVSVSASVTMNKARNSLMLPSTRALGQARESSCGVLYNSITSFSVYLQTEQRNALRCEASSLTAAPARRCHGVEFDCTTKHVQSGRGLADRCRARTASSWRRSHRLRGSYGAMEIMAQNELSNVIVLKNSQTDSSANNVVALR
jgi:hypothetical protein